MSDETERRIAEIESAAASPEIRWLIATLRAAQGSVSALRAENAELRADKARIDWLQENAYQLSTVSEGETNDAIWDVFPNDVDLDEDTEVPSGRSIRAAIDDAMAKTDLAASHDRIVP